MENSIHQGSIFRQRVSVLCREILLDCKTLIGNLLRNCNDASFEQGLSTCNDSCNSLKECVLSFETSRNEKKVALLDQIDKLVSTLNGTLPTLRDLPPGSDVARASSQNLRQEIVDVTKHVIILAKELEEPQDEPQEQIAAKERCLEILEVLCVAIDRQDRSGWKESARQLAQEVQILVRTYYQDNVYSPLILQSVLDLVKESHKCFKPEETEAIAIFNANKAKVIELIQSIRSEEKKETHLEKGLLTPVSTGTEIWPEDNAAKPNTDRSYNESESFDDAVSGEDSISEYDMPSAKNREIDVSETDEFSEDKGMVKSLSLQDLPAVKEDDEHTFSDPDSTNNTESSADNLFSMAAPSPRINALFQTAKYQSNMAQSIFKLIMELFPDKELPEHEQEQLKKDISHVISTEVKNNSNVRTHKKLPSISGEGESPRVSLENILHVPTDGGLGNIGSVSHGLGVSGRIGLPKTNADKRTESAKRPKDKKKGGKPGTLTLTLKKKKERKLAIPEFQTVNLEGDSIYSKLSKELREAITLLLGEVNGFVEHHRDITIVLEERKAPPPIEPEANRTPKIHELIRNIIQILSKTFELIPKEELVQPEGQEEILAIIRVFNRVKASVTREFKSNILELDQDMVTEGFFLPLLKKNLLESVIFRSRSAFFSTSQFLTSLCTFENEACSYYHLLSITDSMDKIVRSLMDDVQTFYHLLDVEKQLKDDSKKKKKSTPKVTKKKSESIWKEEIKAEDDDPNNRFRAGTLNNLIIRLTASATDKDFLNSFLNGYPSFTTPQELFEKFVDRYSVPKAIASRDETSFIKMRVVNVILQWIKKDFHLLDPELIQQIKKFCEKTLSKDQPEAKGKSETSPSARINKELMEEKRYALKIVDPPKEVPIFQTDKSPYRLIMQFDEAQIAEQLTLIELEIFQKIDTSELVGLKWSKPKLQLLAQNVVFLIQRVNQLSFWVAMVILTATSIRRRVKVLTKMINIAKHLAESHNYNSLMGILNGLSLSPVSRLKHTWELLNKVNTHKIFQQYKMLEELQSPMNSFKNLRDSMKGAKSKVLPYLATFLSDLTLIAENQDYVQRGDVELINFNKHYLQTTAIKNLLMYQKSISIETGTKKEPLFTFLNELPGIEEKELFALSQELEPRGSELKNILAKDTEK